MAMQTYVITYNGIDYPDNLLYGYETIQGVTAQDALQKRFNRRFKRAIGDASRFADVILIKGYCIDNTIRYKGKYQRLSYIIVA